MQIARLGPHKFIEYFLQLMNSYVRAELVNIFHPLWKKPPNFSSKQLLPPLLFYLSSSPSFASNSPRVLCVGALTWYGNISSQSDCHRNSSLEWDLKENIVNARRIIICLCFALAVTFYPNCLFRTLLCFALLYYFASLFHNYISYWTVYSCYWQSIGACDLSHDLLNTTS